MDGGEFSLPDTVFIVNIADVSFCTDPGFVPGKVIPGGGGAPFIDRSRKVCGLPMMTLFKERGERGVLVPEFEPGVSEKDGSDFFGMVCCVLCFHPLSAGKNLRSVLDLA